MTDLSLISVTIYNTSRNWTLLQDQLPNHCRWFYRYLIFFFLSQDCDDPIFQRQTGLDFSRRYWYWYFLGPWIETDTDTDTQARSTSRPILILIPWKCTGTDTDTDILLNKNSARTFQKMLRPLDRYRYWYRDSRNPWTETDTDTSCLGIGTFDTIPIFPSVSDSY